ncbi:MAG: hypothetical protein NT062_06200 [Proteobacteria bacterium]|nr:hypothetical protein [Pseudomonadota bacterium]
MSSRLLALAACGTIAAFGCGPKTSSGNPDGGVDGDGNNNQPHKLDSIEVTPLNTLLELDLNTPGQQLFVATGHYLDGASEDLTATSTWASTNPLAGTLTGPLLDIPGFAAATAQTTKINATFDGFIGEAQFTVVAYRKTGAQQDFFFILPYVDPAGDQKKPLEFATAIPALDVFFLMDTTGSMGGEIGNLKNALTGTVIPGIQAAVPNTQFGVGAFMDFPLDPYGNNPSSACSGARNSPDQPFELEQAVTDSSTAITAGVGKLLNGSSPIGCGQDLPEAMLEGFYQASTGEGLTGPSPTSVPANHTGVGGVGFRAGTMPVIVGMTDAMTHGDGETSSCNVGFGTATGAYTGTVATAAHSRAETKAALGNICARVVGVSSVSVCDGQADLEDLATSTGARVPPAAWDFTGTRPTGCAAGQCCTDTNGTGRAPDAQGLCPVVFRISNTGSGLGTSIVTGIQMLTRFATFDVTSAHDGVLTDVDGNPLTLPHTTADFIQAVTPVSFVKPPAPPVLPDPTFDAVAFHEVTPQTKVSFDVTAFNDFVMQNDHAQFFKATIRVLAGGCTALDQRDVLILVPPAPVVIARTK